MKHISERMQWSLVAGAAGVLAVLVARRGIADGWRWWWGDDPPENPAAPDVTWPQALALTGATGACHGARAAARPPGKRGQTALCEGDAAAALRRPRPGPP